MRKYTYIMIILFFLSCKKNISNYEVVKDIREIENTLWIGDKFWFQRYNENKYNFSPNSSIRIDKNSFYQNGELVSKFEFLDGKIIFNDTIENLYGYKVLIKSDDKKLKLISINDELVMVKIYNKKNLTRRLN